MKRSKNSTVGIKTLEATIGDPECPVDEWWAIATDYPLEAMVSPLYPLLTLEEPERWLEIEHRNAERWVRSHQTMLSEQDQRRFACDCAERVLDFWEEAGGDARPRQAIALSRLYAAGNLGEQMLHAAHHGLTNAVIDARREKISTYPVAKSALECVRMSVNAADAGSSALEAIRTKAQGKRHWTDDAIAREARAEEAVWQWRRLAAYCRREVT